MKPSQEELEHLKKYLESPQIEVTYDASTNKYIGNRADVSLSISRESIEDILSINAMHALMGENDRIDTETALLEIAYELLSEQKFYELNPEAEHGISGQYSHDILRKYRLVHWCFVKEYMEAVIAKYAQK